MNSLRTTKYMMTSSNGNIFRVTGPLCGEFTGPGEFPAQRPVTRNFDVYFDLRPNKRLSKQSLGWWFETLSPPLWRHRNELELNQSRAKSYAYMMTSWHANVFLIEWVHEDESNKANVDRTSAGMILTLEVPWDFVRFGRPFEVIS